MVLAAGTRLGPSELTSPLGAGGLGEVHEARDSRLNRNVAIKILPPALSAAPDRRARVRQEGQPLASLNQPNIAATYGFEDPGDTVMLVMELVPRGTLPDRRPSWWTTTSGVSSASQRILTISSPPNRLLRTGSSPGCGPLRSDRADS